MGKELILTDTQLNILKRICNGEYITTSKHLKNIAKKLGYEKGALKSVQRYKRNL